MKKVLQVFGILFIVLIICGGILFVFVRKEYNNANTSCISATKTKLAEIIASGTKDKNGKIIVNDPNIVSVDKFKSEIEKFYGNCMRDRGIPESMINY
jgi:hypothetical protein